MADRPPQAWAWEPRKRLVVVARRVLESQEIVREPEVIGDLHLSLCSFMEERETETADFSEKRRSSPTFATATAKQIEAGNTAVSIPAEAAPSTEEERKKAVVPVYRPPPTPPSWSRHFSSHRARVRRVVYILFFWEQSNQENQMLQSVLRIRNKSFGSGFGSGSSLKLVSDPVSDPDSNPDSNPGFESGSESWIRI
jgi:hypothetical protein